MNLLKKQMHPPAQQECYAKSQPSFLFHYYALLRQLLHRGLLLTIIKWYFSLQNLQKCFLTSGAEQLLWVLKNRLGPLGQGNEENP